MIIVGWVEQRETHHHTMMGFAVALLILHVFYRSQVLRSSGLLPAVNQKQFMLNVELLLSGLKQLKLFCSKHKEYLSITMNAVPSSK